MIFRFQRREKIIVFVQGFLAYSGEARVGGSEAFFPDTCPEEGTEVDKASPTSRLLGYENCGRPKGPETPK